MLYVMCYVLYVICVLCYMLCVMCYMLCVMCLCYMCVICYMYVMLYVICVLCSDVIMFHLAPMASSNDQESDHIIPWTYEINYTQIDSLTLEEMNKCVLKRRVAVGIAIDKVNLYSKLMRPDGRFCTILAKLDDDHKWGVKYFEIGENVPEVKNGRDIISGVERGNHILVQQGEHHALYEQRHGIMKDMMPNLKIYENGKNYNGTKIGDTQLDEGDKVWKPSKLQIRRLNKVEIDDSDDENEDTVVQQLWIVRKPTMIRGGGNESRKYALQSFDDPNVWKFVHVAEMHDEWFFAVNHSRWRGSYMMSIDEQTSQHFIRSYKNQIESIKKEEAQKKRMALLEEKRAQEEKMAQMSEETRNTGERQIENAKSMIRLYEEQKKVLMSKKQDTQKVDNLIQVQQQIIKSLTDSRFVICYM